MEINIKSEVKFCVCFYLIKVGGLGYITSLIKMPCHSQYLKYFVFGYAKKCTQGAFRDEKTLCRSAKFFFTMDCWQLKGFANDEKKR